MSELFNWDQYFRDSFNSGYDLPIGYTYWHEIKEWAPKATTDSFRGFIINRQVEMEMRQLGIPTYAFTHKLINFLTPPRIALSIYATHEIGVVLYYETKTNRHFVNLETAPDEVDAKILIFADKQAIVDYIKPICGRWMADGLYKR